MNTIPNAIYWAVLQAFHIEVRNAVDSAVDDAVQYAARHAVDDAVDVEVYNATLELQ